MSTGVFFSQMKCLQKEMDAIWLLIAGTVPSLLSCSPPPPISQEISQVLHLHLHIFMLCDMCHIRNDSNALNFSWLASPKDISAVLLPHA